MNFDLFIEGAELPLGLSLDALVAALLNCPASPQPIVQSKVKKQQALTRVFMTRLPCSVL